MYLTKNIFVIIFFVILLSFTSIICGQETNSLQIILTDTQNAVITQAFIKVRDVKGILIKEINAKKNKDFAFNLADEGNYLVEIQSAGFKSVIKETIINKGKNILTLTLEIEEIKANINVEQDTIEKRLQEILTKTWSIDEIEKLPDDPNEIEKELKRKYGDDVLIRVNGFTGGQLPPKSMIASIRVTRSAFDAEFHQIGQTVVDIQAKAGGKIFFGFANIFYSNSIFDAGNAFAEEKLPSQNLNSIIFLTFPSIKNRTSFVTGFINTLSYDTQNIVATKPQGKIKSDVKSSSTFLMPNVNVIHNINKEHTLFVSYNFLKSRFNNSGIGGFSLPETAFSMNTTSHTLRLSESGAIKKTANQFRIEFSNINTSAIPNNDSPAITVIGAFSGGGSTVRNSNSQQKISLIEINYFDRNNHSFKLGAEFEYLRNKLNSADNLNGRFTFSSLEDYVSNKPYIYTKRRNKTETSVSQIQTSSFLQNDIKLQRNFQIGLGLRYEWQHNLRDFNNFSPRLNFVWSPDKEAKLVLRSGAGIFYHWLESSVISTIKSNDGGRGSDILIVNPSYPNPIQSDPEGQYSLLNVIQKDEQIKNPYTFISKTGFNYRLGEAYNIEGYYTYRKGVHQFRSRDINAPIRGVRPIRDMGRITQIESSGNVIENSLELKIEGKIKKGFMFDTNYKLGKALSDFEGIFGFPTDSYNTSLDRGPTNADRRHKFNLMVIFPAWKRFSLMTLFKLESPRPYTITTGKDDNGDRIINDRPTGFSRNSEREEWVRQADINLGWRKSFAKEDSKDTLSKIKNQLSINLMVQNLFNHPNRQNFVGIQTSPFFRQATTSLTPRTIRFGISYIF